MLRANTVPVFFRDYVNGQFNQTRRQQRTHDDVQPAKARKVAEGSFVGCSSVAPATTSDAFVVTRSFEFYLKRFLANLLRLRRVIGLVDMDCFYAQVEQRENPELWGKPVIVVQHSRQGVAGGILAVSYEARAFGVKRGQSVVEAKMKCSHLKVCHVPIGEYADKADIQKYRNASAEVFNVLNNFDSSIVIEKASVDEAFLDLTTFVEQNINKWGGDNFTSKSLLPMIPSSHVASGVDAKETDIERRQHLSAFIEACQTDDEQRRLLIAAITIEDIRKRIHEATQFYCSAGIGNNKMMAKLVCARHKPRQQTIVPWQYTKEILKMTPIGDVRGFGGKLGNRIQEKLNVKYMGDILSVNDSWLIESFPDQHEWLRALAKTFPDGVP
ncbi:unnamed protein product [Caenorhabditis sp. 36 PRJEB53466]|nr:unnamed protein product [Caenorhabditis sp. 36 PRJEB53466]